MNESENFPVPAGQPNIIQSPALRPFAHGFLGREGGVSSGMYSSLNIGLGSEDSRSNVLENRRIAGEAVLAGGKLVTVWQHHSVDALIIDAPFPPGEQPKADGMASKTPGILLGVLTADCAPVLFADTSAGVIGAAHAGWRGALGGICDAVIAAMEGLGADRAHIRAAIGPCIAQKSYEVDQAFVTRFCEDDPLNERFFTDGKSGEAGENRSQFDLEGYVAHRLSLAGLTHVHCTGEDTLSQPGRYFSYRRSTLAGEPDYGRQISLIGIAP